MGDLNSSIQSSSPACVRQASADPSPDRDTSPHYFTVIERQLQLTSTAVDRPPAPTFRITRPL
jgi:hypothetical protein